MLSILENLQQLSPSEDSGERDVGNVPDDVNGTACPDEDENVKVQGILLGGDQLSSSMARRVIADRINSMNSIQSLKGVIPVTEDWHTKLCYLTVSLCLILFECTVHTFKF